ncbi:hypothetical protein Anapl_06618 [Anas platyrhynchos]|uniref:Uncharacterized protein n=1 Tax=Anas platyrhynchos TaxID=8839 RepID=R0M051_ANAPL|nr:hypothetical protein Anapl_06618 [Anas platyrhynchos]
MAAGCNSPGYSEPRGGNQKLSLSVSHLFVMAAGCNSVIAHVSNSVPLGFGFLSMLSLSGSGALPVRLTSQQRPAEMGTEEKENATQLSQHPKRALKPTAAFRQGGRTEERAASLLSDARRSPYKQEHDAHISDAVPAEQAGISYKRSAIQGCASAVGLCLVGCIMGLQGLQMCQCHGSVPCGLYLGSALQASARSVCNSILNRLCPISLSTNFSKLGERNEDPFNGCQLHYLIDGLAGLAERCSEVRWDSGRKSGAVSVNEGPSWRRNIWQSCLLKQTRDDHRLVLEAHSEIQDVGQSNLAREDVGKGEGGRNTNRKGGKHSATSKLCHLVGRQCSATYQKLLCESITTALPYCPFWLPDRGVAPYIMKRLALFVVVEGGTVSVLFMPSARIQVFQSHFIAEFVLILKNQKKTTKSVIEGT